MTTPPLCFLDVETDGLHPGRRVWEVAMIRRDHHGDRERHFFVALDLRNSDPKGLEVGGFWDRHPAGRKISGQPPIPGPPVLCKHDAAREIMQWTFGANLVGVNPAFDADTLSGLLRHEGYLPAWHYHLLDVLAMAVGWLHAQPIRVVLGFDGGSPDVTDFRPGTLMTIPATEPTIERPYLDAPWRSDGLSRACGVAPPAEDERHTALGDARWVARWYDAMTGGVS